MRKRLRVSNAPGLAHIYDYKQSRRDPIPPLSGTDDMDKLAGSSGDDKTPFRPRKRARSALDGGGCSLPGGGLNHRCDFSQPRLHPSLPLLFESHLIQMLPDSSLQGHD